jgi:hypothetical protein
MKRIEPMHFLKKGKKEQQNGKSGNENPAIVVFPF